MNEHAQTLFFCYEFELVNDMSFPVVWRLFKVLASLLKESTAPLALFCMLRCRHWQAIATAIIASTTSWCRPQ